MKTEKIDVPKFDGFECIGLRVPFEEDIECYALDGEGKKLVNKTKLCSAAKYWLQPCYRKIKPKRIILESTGEARTPKHGEWYKTSDSCYQKATADMDYSYIREIYRVVEEQS